MNQVSTDVNNSLALKNYNKNDRGRSMRRFCEEEGYDYNKFMQCVRKGQKELSVLKDTDENLSESEFVPLVVESSVSDAFGIVEARVRSMNGMELIKRYGGVNELLGIVRKMLV